MIERLFEAIVGATLNRLDGDLYYWREGNDEVDFVLKYGRKIIAIEVKSGRRKSQKGLSKFCARFPGATPYFITRENYLELERKGLEFFK